MVDSLDARPGFSFWLIGAVALLWNLFGLMLYVMQVSATPEQLAVKYTAEQVELMLSTPPWAISMTAIATTAGVIGCILLLLRRAMSSSVFIISFVALLIQDLYTFGMTDTVAVFGPGPMAIQAAVLIIAIFLIWYARRETAAGILR